MKPADSFRMAGNAVLARKLRSTLTLLGIMIGISSVITLVAVGAGSQRAVQVSISRMGTDTLLVLPNTPGSGGRGSALQTQLRRSLGIKAPPVNGTNLRKPALTYADASALEDQSNVPDAIGAAPGIFLNHVVGTYVTPGSSPASDDISIVIGSTPEFLDIDNDSIIAGRAFTAAEYAAHQRVCVLGTFAVADLAGGGDAGDQSAGEGADLGEADDAEGAADARLDASILGTSVRLNGQPFTVIGVLGPKGFSGQENLDDRAVCTGTGIADALYGYAQPGEGPLNAIVVQAASSTQVPAAQREVTELLAGRHHVNVLNADFVVFSASSALATTTTTNHTLTILLSAVAAISLLVGGIGVMNIQLVAVTERTREIGIRKAAGANSGDIRAQFLGEAVILSMAGGILGLGGGFLASRFTIAEVQPVVEPYSVYLALVVSLLTGVLFGLYPAHRAAKLEPIDALRYE